MNNEMNKIFCELISEYAQNTYDALCKKIKSLSYETAFKVLNGFNLSTEPITINGKFVGISEFFDFNFGCLNGTIFRAKDNKCEIYDAFDFWMADYDAPIARVDIAGDDGKISNVSLYNIS
jgi:hypothetical protein